MKSILTQSPRYYQEFLGIVVLAIIIGLMELVGWLGFLRPAVEVVGLPVSQVYTRAIGSVLSTGKYLDLAMLKPAEVRELEHNYARVLSQLNELEQLRQENQILREILENTDRTLEKKQVTTPIVSLSLPTIAIGQKDGVSIGVMVGARGVLLGRIKEVSDRQSTVELFSSYDSQPLLVKTETGTQGIVQGDGQQVILTQVPREETLASGQRVITVGQPGISSGLLVGTVGELVTKSSDPFQSAVVNQPVSFYDSTIVEVW